MFDTSEKSAKLAQQLEVFMQEHIYPNELAHAQQLESAPVRFGTLPLVEELKERAREVGL
jgi:acyl-CoA dehydrogenase